MTTRNTPTDLRAADVRAAAQNSPSCATTAKADDPVEHPLHYTSHPSGVECIQVAEHMTFCLGNAIKYLWRAGSKERVDPIEDLRKAAWYVNREIARLGGEA